jgi:CzcA family heavy metal efflux pump
MFDRLISFSVRNRLLVVWSALAVLAYGVWVAVHLPVDVLPDLNRPTVTVMTEAPGLAPEEVETLVTYPLETVMNGLPGVVRVRSVSGIGLSAIFVEFDWDTDIFRDRQQVAERLATVKLPEGITPVMGPVSSIMGEVMLLGMTSPALSPQELRFAADWEVRPRLMALRGVAQVTVIGGEVRQLQVRVRPERLQQFDVTLGEVEEAVRRSNRNTGGGFVFRRFEELIVRNLGRSSTPEELGLALVKERDGVPVRLKDVADVGYGARLARGSAGVDGKPAVILAVSKQPGIDTLALTREIERTLEDLRRDLAGRQVAINDRVFRQADFISAAVGNVREALRDGVVLVSIILVVTLLNLRTTAVTLTALPLSFVVSVLVFKWWGLSINTMTLGGLAVAVGELTDDAVVDVENIFRRLKQNNALRATDPARAEHPLAVVIRASREVRASVVLSTIIVCLTFLPVMALSGIEGRLFAPVAVAYIGSLMASLLVSLTVTPALSAYLLPGSKAAERGDGPVVRAFKAAAAGIIRPTLRLPWVVIGMTAAGVGVCGYAVSQMGWDFLPSFNEGTLTVQVMTDPGVSLAESGRIGTAAERLIAGVPEVVSTGRRTGRAELDEHAEGVHNSDIEVDLDMARGKAAFGRERTRAEVIADVRARLDRLPGVSVNIGQPIGHRIDHLLSGVRAELAVKVFGDDPATLRRLARSVEGVMHDVDGVEDLSIEAQTLVPLMVVRVRREDAALYGFDVDSLTGLLETALGGRVVGQVLRGQATMDLTVWTAEDTRRDPREIADTVLTAPSGARVTLSQVADVVEDFGPNQILRENARRRIVVYCNTDGRDLASVVADVQARLDEHIRPDLPPGYSLEYGGRFESAAGATRMITLLGTLSVVGCFVVLYAHFRSFQAALQILLTIPQCFIGAVLAVWLTGGVMTVAHLVGFFSLVGIAARNGILLIDNYIRLAREEGVAFGPELVVRGSQERVTPMLMTTLTALLGLAPLLRHADGAGKELLHPIAVVIFGGLLSTALLDLVFTPTVFLRFGRSATLPPAPEAEAGEDRRRSGL